MDDELICVRDASGQQGKGKQTVFRTMVRLGLQTMAKKKGPPKKAKANPKMPKPSGVEKGKRLRTTKVMKEFDDIVRGKLRLP